MVDCVQEIWKWQKKIEKRPTEPSIECQRWTEKSTNCIQTKDVAAAAAAEQRTISNLFQPKAVNRWHVLHLLLANILQYLDHNKASSLKDACQKNDLFKDIPSYQRLALTFSSLLWTYKVLSTA